MVREERDSHADQKAAEEIGHQCARWQRREFRIQARGKQPPQRGAEGGADGNGRYRKSHGPARVRLVRREQA